jgi:hypothetical protein
MTQRKLKISLACLLSRLAGANHVCDILLQAPQKGMQNVPPIFKTAVNGRSVSACGLGHGSHGEGFLGSLSPQLKGGVQNAFFDIGIEVPGHAFILSH